MQIAGKSLNKVISEKNVLKNYVLQHKINYLCTVFFMVLDLRLNEDCGCWETTFSFLNNIASS